MAAFKGVKLTGRDQSIPVYSLVNADAKTSGLRLSVDRYAGGVDLGGLGWSVRIVSGSDSDIGVLTPVVSDHWITFDWTFPQIVAAHEGLTVFQVAAVDAAKGMLWQSGKYTIMVSEAVSESASYTEDELSLFQQAISNATVKLNAMSTQLDGFEARITTAVGTATSAAASATSAAASATSAESSATSAAASANAAANSATSAAVSATSAASSANTAAASANSAAAGAASAAESATSAASAATAAAGSATSAASSASSAAATANAAAADIEARADAGEFDGADAEVTSESVIEALGYTPADGAALTAHAGNADVHVSASDKSAWSAKQDAIGDLDTIRSGAAAGATAIQSHQDISGKQDVISDLATIRSGAADGSEAKAAINDLTTTVNGKQDAISDLSTIRSGAALGATAIQSHQTLKTINNQSIVGAGNITIEGGGSSYDDTEIRQDISEIKAKTNLLTLYDDVADITGGIVPLTYIGNNGVATMNNNGYFTSDYCSVEGLDSVYVTANGRWGNRLYVFTDADHSVVQLSDKSANSSTGTTITNQLVQVPDGATYIAVSGGSGIAGATVYPKVMVNRGKNLTVLRDVSTLDSIVRKNGKKWVCIGDSLTEQNSRTTMHYFDYVSELLGLTVVNMGKSGTGYKKTEESNTAFYQRASSIPTDADVVTIFGSGNDGTLVSSSLGTPTDTGTDTICGCINTTIDTIIGLMPRVALGIVSPTPWIGNPPSNTNCALYKISDALKTICEYRSIPFLDLYHCSNLRPWTEEGRTACYSKDEGNGVHPDENGHKLIAARFKSFIESLIL